MEIEYSLFIDNKDLYQRLKYFSYFVKNKDISSLLNDNLLSFANDSKNWFKLPVKQLKYFYNLPDSILTEAKENSVLMQDKDNLYFKPIDYNLQALLSYCKNPSLRKRIYKKYMSANQSGKYNNKELLHTILKKKHNLAKTSGTDNYYHLVSKNHLFDKDTVEHFFNTVIDIIEPLYQKRLQHIGFENPQPWDWRFIEKTYYQQNQQFLPQVEFSVFSAFKKILSMIGKEFKLSFIEKTQNNVTFGKKLKTFEVYDKKTRKKAILYFDLIKREDKNSTVNLCENLSNHSFYKTAGLCQNLIILNFAQKVKFSDILIMVHEMGHFLKNFFAQNKYSLINQYNMSQDLIEIPSQYVEKLFIFKYGKYFVSKKDTANLNYYCQENRLISFYQNLLVARDKMNLFIKYQDKRQKGLKEFFDLQSNGHNIYNDYFMFSNSDYLDYGATPYVYALCDLMAYSLYKQNLSSREIFEGVFNFGCGSKIQENIKSITYIDKDMLEEYLV